MTTATATVPELAKPTDGNHIVPSTFTASFQCQSLLLGALVKTDSSNKNGLPVQISADISDEDLELLAKLEEQNR